MLSIGQCPLSPDYDAVVRASGYEKVHSSLDDFNGNGLSMVILGQW